jgi:uncharacterized membrane-anchored protein YhcB (DUF1043 family)
LKSNTTASKKSKETQNTATPAGTYLERAEAALRGVAGVLTNPDVQVWVEQQQAAGVEVGQLNDKWNAPENAEFAKQQKALTRVSYVIDELERMVESQIAQRTDLAEEIQAADAEKVTEVAADSAQRLVTNTAKVKTFTRFLDAVKNRLTSNHAPAEIFGTVSQYVFNDLAKNATHLSSRNTSWQENERRMAEVAALGEVASLFLDIARI